MECLTRLRRRCDLRRDEGNKQARRPSLYIFQAFIGAFLGILTLAKLDHSNAFTHTQLEESDAVMIVGSFGAQAVLLFAAPAAPLAQPWNCIVGNGISAFVGVSSYKLFTDVFDSDLTWVAAACAVSISIALMLYTKSVHPPGK